MPIIAYTIKKQQAQSQAGRKPSREADTIMWVALITAKLR